MQYGNTMNIDRKQEFFNEYKYGFISDVKSDFIPKGLNEKTVRLISEKKKEPIWLLNWRLRSYRYFNDLLKRGMEPSWGNINYNSINYNEIIYYSAPKIKKKLDLKKSIDLEVFEAYKKLNISLDDKEKNSSNVAIDAIFDSVSVATTFKKKLSKMGIIFCSFSDAVSDYSNLIKKYLGTVVPYTDNFFVALNSSVFSDGSFCFIPKNTICPMELSSYFRINSMNTGQFERTLIIAEEFSSLSYIEGCSASKRIENQLHAAVVEIIALKNSKVKYSTVQNWYPGDEKGNGGIYNFVTKRGICKGVNSKISWIQVETGSSVTWKYPSTVLLGESSVGEFYSITVSNHYQQADTGTKMIHIGKNTKSTIVSKGISSKFGRNTYRGMVKIYNRAKNAGNYSQCDSLLFGKRCSAYSFPIIDIRNNSSRIEHEAFASKISDEQLFYCKQRGIETDDAVLVIVSGFCKSIFSKLPTGFLVEAEKLIRTSIEKS